MYNPIPLPDEIRTINNAATATNEPVTEIVTADDARALESIGELLVTVQKFTSEVDNMIDMFEVMLGHFLAAAEEELQRRGE